MSIEGLPHRITRLDLSFIGSRCQNICYTSSGYSLGTAVSQVSSQSACPVSFAARALCSSLRIPQLSLRSQVLMILVDNSRTFQEDSFNFDDRSCICTNLMRCKYILHFGLDSEAFLSLHYTIIFNVIIITKQ